MSSIEIDKISIGHKGKGFENCDIQIQDLKKHSKGCCIVENCGWVKTPDKKGNVCVAFRLFNATEHTITRINIDFVAYDANQNAVACNKTSKAVVSVTLNKPLLPHTGDFIYTAPLWRNPNIKEAKIRTAEVHIAAVDVINGDDIVPCESQQSVYYDKIIRPSRLSEEEIAELDEIVSETLNL